MLRADAHDLFDRAHAAGASRRFIDRAEHMDQTGTRAGWLSPTRSPARVALLVV